MNKLSVCFIGLRLETCQYHVVVSQNEESLQLPCIEIVEDKTIKQILEQLIITYVDLDVNWIPTKLISVIKEGLDLNVIYSAHIPYDTQLKNNAKWVSNITEFPSVVEAIQYI